MAYPVGARDMGIWSSARDTRALGPFFFSSSMKFGTWAGICGIGISWFLYRYSVEHLKLWYIYLFKRRRRRRKLCTCIGLRCLLLTRANFETLATPPLQIPTDHTPTENSMEKKIIIIIHMLMLLVCVLRQTAGKSVRQWTAWRSVPYYIYYV